MATTSGAGPRPTGQRQQQKKKKKKQPPSDEEVWTAAFKRLDKKKRGAIPLADLGEALRRARFVLSEEDVQEYARETAAAAAAADVADDGGGDRRRVSVVVELPQFLAVAARAKMETLTADQWTAALGQAFLAFDKVDAGRLKAEDLRRWLTQLGEPLPEKDVARMLRGLIDQNGMVVYQDVIKRLASI